MAKYTVRTMTGKYKWQQLMIAMKEIIKIVHFSFIVYRLCIII